MKSVDIRCRVSTVGIDFFFLFLIFCQPLIFFPKHFCCSYMLLIVDVGTIIQYISYCNVVLCVCFCAPYIVMMLYLLMPLNIFFSLIFFSELFFGLYIMGGVVKWMIWKGSYKFSLIFLFTILLLLFLLSFTSMVQFVLKFDFQLDFNLILKRRRVEKEN